MKKSFFLFIISFLISQNNPQYIEITSASAGTLSKINPPILGKQNQQIKFNLGDSSLICC